jgi:hypothetical protein
MKTETQKERSHRGGMIYTLGLAFMILMSFMYIKADLFLGWIEAIVRALFM